MPNTTSPSSPPVFPTWPMSSPANGEPDDATDLKNEVIVPTVNGIEAARLAVVGSVGARRVTCSDAATIVVHAPGSVVLRDGNGFWKTEQQLADFGAYTPVGIVASTGYYLYLMDNGSGALSVIHTANPPDAALQYENGSNQTKAFIGYFSTDASGNITKFETTGYHTILASRPTLGGGVSGNLMLDQGNATMDTTVSFTAAIPPQARRVVLHAYMQTSDASLQLGIVYSGVATRDGVFLDAENTRPTNGQVAIAPQTAAAFHYFVGTNNCLCSVFAAEYTL